MVDRIVPATTATDLAEVASVLGLDDAAAVVTEPFSQWVIEDTFAGARPRWELAGAILTSDVGPYESMKLRLLNGSHSALAYLGIVAGYTTVADFMGGRPGRRFRDSIDDRSCDDVGRTHRLRPARVRARSRREVEQLSDCIIGCNRSRPTAVRSCRCDCWAPSPNFGRSMLPRNWPPSRSRRGCGSSARVSTSRDSGWWWTIRSRRR